MTLPSGLSSSSRADGVGLSPAKAHHTMHEELHGFYNIAANGDYTTRQLVMLSHDDAVPITDSGIPGLIANRARRFTIIDGKDSVQITQDLATGYMSRNMASVSGQIYAETDVLLLVAKHTGSVGPAGFASANGLISYGLSKASDADNLGVGGIGLVDDAALHSVRNPTGYGLFGEGVTESPYGRMIGMNALIAAPNHQRLADVSPYFSAGIFVQPYPLARNAGISNTVTITIASPAVFTWLSHNRKVGDTIKLTTTGSLPTGLTAGNTYYVSAIVDADHFRVSATLGGSDINTSGTQSGTHTATPYSIYGPAFMAYANYPANAQHEVGFYMPAGSVADAFLRSEDSATTLFDAKGTHTYGNKFDGGTYGYWHYYGANHFFTSVIGTYRHQVAVDDYWDYVTASQQFRWLIGGVEKFKVGSYGVGMVEQTAPLNAPANEVIIFARDNGGKTELCAIFEAGAIQRLAIEP